MGIQINGQTDTITATDGSFTIQGASGNLTGDLVGNVTGNLTGNVTGNLTGNVTGDLTGNVSGNVNATGVSTFSNIRVTGGTISGVSTAGITTVYTNSIRNTSGNTILQSSGSIIKVTSVNNPTDFNTASGSYVAVTGFTTTITPSSASNRYYAIATIAHANSYASSIVNYDSMRLTSSGTGAVDKYITAGFTNSNDGSGYVTNCLSSFGTFTNVGIHTFAIYTAQTNGNSTTVLNAYSGGAGIPVSNLTIFEIAG